MDNKESRAKVKVVVVKMAPGEPGWPHIDYDYEKKTEEILEFLRAKNPDMDFEPYYYYSASEAKACYEEDKKKYDGVLLLLTTLWKDVTIFYADQARDGLPVIAADVLYAGSGEVLRLQAYIQKNNLNVPVLATSDWMEVARACRIFYAIHRMKRANILLFTERDPWIPLSILEDIWGCRVTVRGSDALKEAQEQIDEEEAKKLAQKWMRESEGLVDTTPEDVYKGAVMYKILELLKEKEGADIVTVDCLNLIYEGKWDKYPCLAFFEMGNQGNIGVCEGDLDSAVTSQVMRWITGRVGYVSDPVIDTSKDQIIYAHCVACRKVYGDERACPYYLRSHAEDKKGASVQAILPTNEPLTTVKLNHVQRNGLVHSAYSVGNDGGEAGCRTKLVAKAKADKILENYDLLTNDWHRVTFYGDYRKEFLYLCKTLGFSVCHEDQ